MKTFFGFQNFTTTGAILTAAALFLAPSPAGAYSPGNVLQYFEREVPQTAAGFGDRIAPLGKNVAIASENASGVTLYNGTTGAKLFDFVDPEGLPSGWFGYRLHSFGTTLLITDAAEEHNGAYGAVHIYDGKKGTLKGSLYNPHASGEEDDFGSAVAFYKGNYFIGAALDDTDSTFGDDRGIVYLMSPVTGQVLDTYHNPDPANTSGFGSSIAVNKDSIFICAPFGNASIFQFSLATGDLIRTYSGVGFAVSGNYLVISGADTSGPSPMPAVFLYNASTGNLIRRLANGETTMDSGFGWSIAISVSRILVGGPWMGAEGAGRAYMYDLKTGNYLGAINAPFPTSGDRFGHKVAFGSGKTILISAPGEDMRRVNDGAVYLLQGY